MLGKATLTQVLATFRSRPLPPEGQVVTVTPTPVVYLDLNGKSYVLVDYGIVNSGNYKAVLAGSVLGCHTAA